jgi:mannose-6-phosphate isomerase-like protein (cupin superfamily)
MKNRVIGGIAAAITAVLWLPAAATAGVEEIEAILQSYVDDYATDVTRFDATFGVLVEDNWWTVTVAGDETTLARGAPAEPTYYYLVREEETLHQIDRGELSMLTGMVKAFSTDVVPTDVDVMEGYQPPEDFQTWLMPQIFHFWNRGFPEIVPFGDGHTLPSHGGHVSVLYYQPGFRSGWGYLAPGEHANEDPRSRSNPFPSLFIALEGTITARINGVDHEFSEGNFMIIPAGVEHEFINETDENVHFMLFMFGEGA